MNSRHYRLILNGVTIAEYMRLDGMEDPASPRDMIASLARSFSLGASYAEDVASTADAVKSVFSRIASSVDGARFVADIDGDPDPFKNDYGTLLIAY